MLNCFWTECSVAFILLFELSTMPFQGPVCGSLASFLFLLFSKFRLSKRSDPKIFGHFNFWTKSLSEIKLGPKFFDLNVLQLY